MINKIAEDFEKIVVVTKSKELKRCSKMFYQNRKNEKTTMKNKPEKIGKTLRTTYCFGFKDFSHNFRPQEVRTTNKVLREKSNCVVCQSNKARFLKQKHNKK